MPAPSRRHFVAGALAATAVSSRAVPSLAAPDPSLSIRVNALPSTTPAQERKKAMLLWAVEDIAAAQAAGMSDDASALTADVEVALTRDLGNPTPTPAGLFPKIATRQNNPWLDKTLQKVKSLITTDKKFPRGANPDAKDLGIKYGYPYIQLGQEGTLLAHAFGSMETEYFGNPTLLAPMLRRFAASYEILTPASKHLADFGVSPHISEMYCLLKSSFPDLILPSRQRIWEQALNLNCEAILRGPSQAFSEPGMPTETLEALLQHPGPGATLHTASERHRLPFLPQIPSAAPIDAPSTLTIAPGQHIVLRTA